MPEYYPDLFARYRNEGIIVDANLLLLYFVGSYDSSLIGEFKRTKVFNIEDYNLIASIIQYFNKVVTTPNILTEVSNLSTALPERRRFDYFGEFAKQVLVLEEIYVESQQACDVSAFYKFGLTDSVIIYVSQKQYLVLTADFPLAGYLQKMGVEAINFNNIRYLNWSNWQINLRR